MTSRVPWYRGALLPAFWLAAAALPGCADGSNAPLLALNNEAPGTSRVYRLGVGDKLKINVFGEDSLSGTYEVGATGQIVLPLIGEVPAGQRAIEEFRVDLSRRLSQGYLKSPRVTVDVLNFRPIYIHGEVRTGGEFPYRNGLKLRDAIAVAGGYTYRANERYVLLVREGAKSAVRVQMPSSLDVLPGDNIRVPERFF